MAREFIDNTKKIQKEVEDAIKGILDDVGIRAEADVTNTLTSDGLVGKGGLRQSITHITMKDEVHVGSALDYAVYHEFGTGIHAEGGKGRKGWWVYVEGSEKKGGTTHKTYSFEEAKKIMAILRSKGLKAHMTQGVKASHYLKRSIEGNLGEYNRMIENGLAKVMDKYRN